MAREQADISTESRRGEQVMAEMEDSLRYWLVEEGIDPERAARVAGKVADRIGDEWRAIRVIFPTYGKRMTDRNAAICAAYDGNNTARLAMEYGLSEERIRQIIRAEDARRKARRTGDST